MEDVASLSGGHPSRQEAVSATTSAVSSNTSSTPLPPFQASSNRDPQSPPNHRRRYTGSSIPLRPEGPLPPALSNGFAPISAPSVIGPVGFDSIERFRSNLGYTAFGTSAATTSWNTNTTPSRLTNSALGPRHSIANLQPNLKSEIMLPAPPPPPPSSSRPQYRSQRSSNHSLSNSMPSTPRHPRTRHDAGKSRSPSPTPFTLDSPRSAASDPSTHPVMRTRCQYESGLVLQRRRIPYSIGSDPLPDEKPPKDSLSKEDEDKLTADMEKLYGDLLPSDESNERRRKFLAKLEKLLNDEWPGHEIKVHPFGSTENKLCSTDSDVDVCIVTTFKDVENVCLLAKVLGKHHMERIVCVQNAKVPIVRIWDPEYKVQCDMNVNNTLALENTRMVKTYVDIDPRVRPLAMIIKHWTKQRILNDAAGGGTLSSYTWICMMINFLQTREPPILPSLHQREHKKLPPQNGVDVSFDDDIEKLRGFGDANNESLGSLLFNFFKRYGYEIDFEKSVVSIRMGKLISKAEKKWDNLFGNRLCVEEPFSISRNLSNGADDNAVRGIHEEFRRAFKLLAESPPNITGWSEEYVFPKEEHISADFVKPASRPVQMTRSNSANKGRSGDSGRSRNRQFGGHGSNPRNSTFNSRRASSGSNYAHTNLPAITTHLMATPGGYQFVQNPDGTFSYPMLDGLQKPLLDVQHAQRQATLSRQNLLHTFAQAHAASQLANPNTAQGQAQLAQANSQLEAAGKQQHQAQTNLLATQTQLGALHVGYPAYLLYPPILYLPNGLGGSDQYNMGVPPSSPIPQNSLEQRLNRTKNLQPGGPRSRSQPAPHLEAGGRQIPTVVESAADVQDMLGGSESIATASSTSEQPPTPCELPTSEDTFGDYYGYLYPDAHSLAGHAPEVYVNQKDIMDPQRRLSKEKMAPPKFSDHRRPSQPPSPITTANHSRFIQNPEAIWSSSEGDGERSISQDSYDEEPRQRGPVIVNGSASSVPVTPPFDTDDSPQLSLHGDSPHEDALYHSPAGYTDSYGVSMMDHSHPHAAYGHAVMHDETSNMPKTGYTFNPYTGQPIHYPAFLQFHQPYAMAQAQNLDAHTSQKLRHRQNMQQQYGRQYEVEQVISASKYANQMQPHLDLATPSHSVNHRESKQPQSTKEKPGNINTSHETNGSKHAGHTPTGSWKSPSPTKNGSGRKGAANKHNTSEGDNSSEDGNANGRQNGHNNHPNKSGGTIRASKVMEAIQAITKSAGTAGQASGAQGSKAGTSSASAKLEDSPMSANHGGQSHNPSKSKEWNKNSKRKSNKKKRTATAEAALAAGEERKGG
ncbi:hypothetical protein Dda_7379 [Drechslerella dactyloides]|uniref:polynucleotide adenylyltransferase n=1 Tax=Drechslerella dactyloides TaxID=74499 RepID=A0AAD6IS52_DREDA|nr:hypothetical protein Dda_7379 [Drechslerella dactyloides]